MELRLNHMCKRLFLALSAKKCCRTPSSSIGFVKYPILSRSFLDASRLNSLSHSGPVYRLVFIVDEFGSLRVSITDETDKKDGYYQLSPHKGPQITSESIRKLISLLNPRTVHVDVAVYEPFDLNQIQDIFDDYQGKLLLNLITSYTEYLTWRISLVNKWNPKILSIRTEGDLLVHKDTQPLDLDHCDLRYYNLRSVTELLSILDRHKIKHLSTSCDFDDGNKEEERTTPPKNIGTLEHLEAYLDLDEFDILCQSLSNNNIKLEQLSIKSTKSFCYWHYDSMTKKLWPAYRHAIGFKKQQYSKFTQKLHVEVTVAFELEWQCSWEREDVESYRDKCEILKEAEYYTRGHEKMLQGLKATFVDGNFTLDFRFEVVPHGY